MCFGKNGTPLFAKNRNDETDSCRRHYLGQRIRHCVVLSILERRAVEKYNAPRRRKRGLLRTKK
jgi:hypothetical protein